MGGGKSGGVGSLWLPTGLGGSPWPRPGSETQWSHLRLKGCIKWKMLWACRTICRLFSGTRRIDKILVTLTAIVDTLDHGSSPWCRYQVNFTFWNGSQGHSLQRCWLFSYHRTVSLAVNLPIFLFSFYQKNKFAFTYTTNMSVTYKEYIQNHVKSTYNIQYGIL